MSMTVGSNWHGIVEVVVMPVIVAMSVLVFHCLMLMIVGVHLGQVQQDAQNHKDGARYHPQAANALAQHDREQRTDKGCKREYRACAGGTERALSQQIEAQTQTVASGADQQETERRPQ